MNAENTYWYVRQCSRNQNHGKYQQKREESIVELTGEGVVFIWPVEPDRTELCDVCRRCPHLPDTDLLVFQETHCSPPEGSSLPCAFLPMEMISKEDIAAFLVDGSCLDGGGYYKDLADYMSQCGLSLTDYEIRPLGQHQNIRDARMANITSIIL